MKKLIVLSLLIFGVFVYISYAEEVPSGETILKRIDENYDAESRISTAALPGASRRPAATSTFLMTDRRRGSRNCLTPGWVYVRGPACSRRQATAGSSNTTIWL